MGLDTFLIAADSALRTVWAPAQAARSVPQGVAQAGDAQALTAEQQAHAAALMRVNHVGEVCAQALYTAQALATRNPALRHDLLRASAEETDHLAWTAQRLEALGGQVSLLNPLWYAGAFGLGLLAGRAGDAVSLGFVVETERQVGAHLQSHLQTDGAGLPTQDADSRAIVAQMYEDELRHADAAQAAGAVELPLAVKTLMRMAAKVMTTVAHRI